MTASFDEISQQWLVRFLEHRIGDRRIIRLIQKWLKVGVLEDGIVTVSDKGTGQGSVISPLLANIYLHYYGQRNVSSVMLAISEELDQSSRMAGASWFTTLRRITIPLLKPGIFAGWVLLFIIFLRELSISIILYTSGTETLSVGVYYLVNFENEPLTAALSIAQTVVLLLCVIVFRRVAGREALTA